MHLDDCSNRRNGLADPFVAAPLPPRAIKSLFPRTALSVLFAGALPASFLAVAACDDQARSVNTPLVDTLPTGIVVVDNTPLVTRADTSPWTLTEDIRIGAVDGQGPAVFGEIYFFAVDDDGGMYILDGQAQEIRYFSADGGYLRTVASRGEGPGEISGAAGLAWDPVTERLWVWDPGNRRYSVFNADGEFVTSHRRTVSGVVYPWRGGIVNGQFIDLAYDRPGATGGAIGTHNRYEFVRLSGDFETLDTLLRLEHPIDLINPRFPRPLGARLTFVLAPSGTIWHAVTTEYRFYQRSLTGDTLMVVSLPQVPLRTTAAERDSLAALYPPIPGATVTPGDVPDTKPLVQRLVVDETGHLVVFPTVAPERQGSVFDVFAPSGEYLGRVDSPVAFDNRPPPEFYGQYMYGVTKDELDIEYLVRLEIVRHP